MWECAAVRDERSCVLLTSLTGTVVIVAVANELGSMLSGRE